MRNILIFTLVLISYSLAFTQEKNHIIALDYNFDKAFEYYYTNTDSAIYYFNKVKKQAIKHGEIEYAIEAIISENWAANLVYDLALIKKNLAQLDSILVKNTNYINSLDQKDYYISTTNYSKALFEYELKDYKKALFSFKTLVEDIEKIPGYKNNIDIFNLYLTANNFIAKIYTNEGQYKLARQLYEQNIRTIEAMPEANIELANNLQILLAELYEKEGYFEKANATILKNLNYHTTIKKNSNRVISSYQSVVNNHINLKQLDSADFYLKKIKDNLPKEHPFWYRYHEAKAKILETNNNYPEAEKELQIVLELLKERWKNQTHNDIAEAYNNIGLLHAKFKKPNAALKNYDLALQQFSKKNNSSIIHQTIILRVLKNKAEVLNKLINYSETIFTVNEAIETLDLLKPSFKNNTDKLFLMEEAFPVFESGLEAIYNLYKTTKQDSLIDKAFFYAEKSKSVLLLEALLSTKATKFANIPNEIIEQEQLLKLKINHIEKQINTSTSDALHDELFQLRNSYRELITKIETNYKSYYNLKYNSQVITISELQKQLKPEDVLLSYFYGNNAIYTIAITKNSKTIKQYQIADYLEEKIISIYQMLNKPKSDLTTLNNKSFQLYNKLVAPSLVNIQPKNLIIIADGLLNYIPFSGLNTNLEKTRYLVEDYAISYVNSATLLKQLTEKEGINNKVLAFAPSFNTSTSTLLTLPNNVAEATDILQYFKGKTLTNKQATLENFNIESSKYGILHFATHAIVNDEAPEYSYLAFQPNSTKNDLLYVSDLYNLNLNTNLVTLSACETGIGDLKRGEGFLSLARGFYFSGASSIASTLWKINDASSLKIMDDFYKNLSNKETKNIALQKAQLNFLNTNKHNALVHPYYWSGFVISGNTATLGSSSKLVWYLLAIVVLFLIASKIKKRKKLHFK